jgi:hypothetical protein
MTSIRADSCDHVQTPHTEAELSALRRRVQRGSPYGSTGWVAHTAVQLGLESSLHEPGRPCGRVSPEPEVDSLFVEKDP